MSSDRARTLAEVIGVSAIVISLVFVGFELKQTRDMNLAELQFKRLSLFHSLMLASLESESVLNASLKIIYTEDDPRISRFHRRDQPFRSWVQSFEHQHLNESSGIEGVLRLSTKGASR